MDENMSALMARLEELVRNVHQYVGARYVPHFIDEPWNNITGYEALDVVDNGSGTSYIAKKTVPAGTPLSNREYWFVYGSTSGAIINLQNQIDDILDGSISGSLQNQIDNIDSNIESLQKLHERRIIYIGDSFMYGPGVLTTSLNYRLHPKASYNRSHGATGFVRNTDDLSFVHQLENAAADTSIPHDDITDIIIVGGINDDAATTMAQYETAIQSMVDTCNASFPHAKMWFVPMAWGNSELTLTDQQKYNKIYNACVSRGVATLPYAYTFLGGYDTSRYMADSVHPNANGCAVIAGYIADWVNGGTGSRESYDAGNAQTTRNEAVSRCIIERGGFIDLTLFFYSRDVTYPAGTKIMDISTRINLSSGLRLPMTSITSAGTYSGQLYIQNGGLYSTTDFGYCDVTAHVTIPHSLIY